MRKLFPFTFVFIIYLLFACSNTAPSETQQENSEKINRQADIETETAFTVLPTHTAAHTTEQTIPAVTPSTSISPLSDVEQLPDAQGYEWRTILEGLRQPVYLTHANDGSSRIYILEQPGVVQIIEDGLMSPTPFLDIQERVGNSGSEQGLLGLAFHPEYDQNGTFFVNYTDLQGDTIIARYQRLGTGLYTADPASEEILLKITQPYANHNGGQITFGPDDMLYIGTGDGGSAGDPQGNGQSIDTLLGKILRIDVDRDTSYSVPPDNPFNTGSGLPEIFSFGLRNPWRFSFDSQTGDLYIADVGQNKLEEINHSPAGSQSGANYGWNYLEGSQIFAGPVPGDAAFTAPVTEYGHAMGCSVTGGYVYRGNQLPEFFGVYIFGDYCTGHIWGLTRDQAGNWQSELLFENIARISSFGLDQQGEIYVVDHAGAILKLVKK